MLANLPASAVLAALVEALESAGLGCTVVVDRGDRFERAYVNAAMARLYGVDLETLQKTPVMGLLPPDERARLNAMRASLGADPPGPSVVETIISRPDGTTRPVELALGYSVLEGARTTFCFMRDVSAQAKMAAALRESEARFRTLGHPAVLHHQAGWDGARAMDQPDPRRTSRRNTRRGQCRARRDEDHHSPAHRRAPRLMMQRSDRRADARRAVERDHAARGQVADRPEHLVDRQPRCLEQHRDRHLPVDEHEELDLAFVEGRQVE